MSRKEDIEREIAELTKSHRERIKSLMIEADRERIEAGLSEWGDKNSPHYVALREGGTLHLEGDFTEVQIGQLMSIMQWGRF